MRLIDADYLTGRMFTEADLSNAHTCYDSIRAIIESMESEDVLDKIRAEIDEQKHHRFFDDDMCIYKAGLIDALEIIDKYRNEVSE